MRNTAQETNANRAACPRSPTDVLPAPALPFAPSGPSSSTFSLDRPSVAVRLFIASTAVKGSPSLQKSISTKFGFLLLAPAHAAEHSSRCRPIFPTVVELASLTVAIESTSGKLIVPSTFSYLKWFTRPSHPPAKAEAPSSPARDG